MFMIRPDGILNFENELNAADSVLIVDNAGASQYNMNSLEQSFVMGHNKVRNVFGNRFTITIAEPNGVTLLNTIRRAANKLGILNHQQAVYVIQIEFNGRMPSGAANKHPQVFYYPVTIKDFQFTVTEGGTNYFITAVENSTNAYTYLNNVVKDQITIEAGTVGDFFDKFVAVANKTAEDAIVYSVDQLFFDTLEISFDDSISSWRDWQFQALVEESTQGHVNIMSVTADGGDPKLQVTINNGSNLTDIFTTILGLTSEYKNIVLHGNGKKYGRKNPHEDADYTLDQLPVFHKVVTNVEYGAYDILRGTYTKNVQYKVVPYIIADEIISPTSYLDSIADAGIQASRVQNLMDSALLRKRYDYIYTGANTEVLEFDIKIDRAYYAITAYGGGKNGDADILTPVESKARTSVVARFVSDDGRRREDIARAEGEKLQVGRKASATTSYDEKKRLGTLGAALEVKIKGLRTEYRTAVTTLTSTLAEHGMSAKDVVLMQRFASDVVNDDDAAGSDNSNQGGKLKFGALNANLDNTGDLMRIELGIRGDPYWMGQPNSFYKSSLSEDDSLAAFERGTIGFFLHCSLPQPVEDNHGRRKPDVEYEISGFYTVRDVIAKYANGQFTMYLGAVRDIATNTSSALTALDTASPKGTATSSELRLKEIDAAAALEAAMRRV
jgi:hypothetical protein